MAEYSTFNSLRETSPKHPEIHDNTHNTFIELSNITDTKKDEIDLMDIPYDKLNEHLEKKLENKVEIKNIEKIVQTANNMNQQEQVNSSVNSLTSYTVQKHDINKYTGENLPVNVVEKIGFLSLKPKVQQYNSIKLIDIIQKNTNQYFKTGTTKYCYKLNYETLSFSHLNALDNYSDSMVNSYADSYTPQHMNSISGESKDICFYTYSPTDLSSFLRQNKNHHYTFLPVTVYATDSANGKRHDMLLIFDNKTLLFYWFDCKNREDYLPMSRNMPKNVIDILFTLFSDSVRIGYLYEPSPSWMVQNALYSYGSLGDFDFLISTAWCYNIILSLKYYDSPTSYMTVLDSLSENDRFHLMYTSMMDLLNVSYRKTIPDISQVDLVNNYIPQTNPQNTSNKKSKNCSIM